MTQKIVFTDIAMEASKCIQENGTLLDVNLMIRLEFSPPAWKVWKPKLIEKLSSMTMLKINQVEGGEARIKITYDKKQKLWKST